MRSEFKVAILIAILATITYIFFSPMQALPSPIYGGDVYFHYGVVKYIYDGNNPLGNSQFAGAGAHYPWLMHLMVAYVAKITHMDIFRTAILFPVLMTVLAGVVSWMLAKRAFANESIALIFTALFTAGMMMPMLTATAFTILVTFPLFIALAFFSKNKILTGISLGLVGLSQIAGFVGAILFMVLLSSHRYLTRESSLKAEFKQLFFVGAIGGAISLLYWWQPIFVYHLHTPNNWSAYVASGPNLSFGDVITKLQNLFFNFNSVNLAILSLTSLAGLVLCLFNLKKEKVAILPVILFLTGFIGFIHPLITLPLLHTSIGSYGFDIVFLLATPLLSIMFFYLMLPKIPDVVDEASVKKIKARTVGVLATCSLIVAIILFNTYSTFNNDQWTNVGRQQNILITELQNATKILDASPRGVILPLGDEAGFAINSISGKQVVFARRTHTSPYVDANKRIADAAVMLYGNNSVTRDALLKQYGVKYFYTDANSVQDTDSCYSNWAQIQGDYSFLCLVTSPAYEKYLTENGIAWKETVSRLDPASAVAPVFTVVVIKPNPINLNVTSIFLGQTLQLSKVNT